MRGLGYGGSFRAVRSWAGLEDAIIGLSLPGAALGVHAFLALSLLRSWQILGGHHVLCKNPEFCKGIRPSRGSTGGVQPGNSTFFGWAVGCHTSQAHMKASVQSV